MGKISADGALRFLKSMHAAGAVYLWGANCEVITEELLEELKRSFGTDQYKKISLETVEGKIGADCSGLLEPLSGEDNTAAGYYSKCKEKGNISKMQRDMFNLLFRRENGKIVHVAVYTGDGMLYEMWNGCEHRKFVESQWDLYGVPDWIDQPKKKLAAGDIIEIKKELTGHKSAADAIAGKNVRNKVVPGKYHVYKVYGKAVNVTGVKNVPGSWVVL